MDPADPPNPTAAQDTPRFTHDCTKCVFLGTVMYQTFRGEEIFDLYFCDKAGYRTFIYRHGDDGPEYSSVPDFALPDGPHPALFECVSRARKKSAESQQPSPPEEPNKKKWSEIRPEQMEAYPQSSSGGDRVL